VKPIPYTRPSITAREVACAAEAAEHGWGPRCYEAIQRFEALFAQHLGIPYAIATSSCTGALHMGLAAMGVGPGDEVILADTNWIATAAPIVHLGAKPVFVDILPDTWCIDPSRAEAAVTPRTKAIVATHIYGNLCEMDALLEMGNRRGIAIVEDAAEAIGSTFRGRRAGSMGRFGTFSFHGTKTITTGEGGMFVTSDPELFHKVSTLSNHGRRSDQTRQFWPDEVGFKYKMSNLQAAIGCAQMERVGELVDRKRQILRAYRDGLASRPELAMNAERADRELGAWMPTVVFPESSGVTRERMQEAFRAQAIDARVFFHPLSSLPMFEDRPENRHAWSIPTRAINLPSFHDISEEEISRVVSIVLSLGPS
jgi:perosamine synthetase